MGINVLSLFDGISCGRVALERCGFKINRYYASEIDKYAITVAANNYLDTIHIGDVTKVRAEDLDPIDLLIGGTPCQGFSFAGKQLNFEDPRSMLFFEFVRLIKECKPKYFFLENVVMKKEYQDVISSYLGVQPIMLNSALVSAQSRKRLYWTNIPSYTPPEDKGILLKDIIISGAVDRSKSYCLDASYYKGGDLRQYFDKSRRQLVFEAPNGKKVVITPEDVHEIKTFYETRNDLGKQARREARALTGLDTTPRSKDHKQYLPQRHEKSNCLVTVDSFLNYIIVPEATVKGFVKINANEGVDLTFINSKTRRGRRMENKSNCLTAAAYDYNWFDGFIIRKLTPVECERLQTLPDNYTAGASNSQRYKMLGNGWTVDAVCEFFKHIPKDLDLF